MKNFQQDNLKSRVYDALLEMIKDEEFPEGKLPSEPKLSKEMGISRSTLRSVLILMEQEGLVIRKHGVGTFINYGINRLNVNIINPIKVFDIIRLSGYTPSLEYQDIVSIKPNSLIKDKLKLDEDEKIIFMKRVFGAGGKPAVYVEEHVPEKLLYEDCDFADLPLSIYTIAEECTSEDISFTFTDIIPLVAKEKLIEYLNCEEYDPILLMEEIHFNSNTEPLMFSRVYSSDKFIRFQMVKNNTR